MPQTYALSQFIVGGNEPQFFDEIVFPNVNNFKGMVVRVPWGNQF